MPHKSVTVTLGETRIIVKLDIEADEDKPSATLSGLDAGGELLRRAPVAPNFVLSRSSAEKWATAGFRPPR